MRKILIVAAILLRATTSIAQENMEQQTRPIVEEGKRLYRSEMASWYGTDIFIANYKNTDRIGGYFSYTEKDISTCIFFSREESPKVIGTISFDSTYKTTTAFTDFNERPFTELEEDLYHIRKAATNAASEDTFFKQYNNTNYNFIPIYSEGVRKVYILTGTSKSGIVIFGNDYLLTFDKDNKLISKKRIHQNILTIEYGGDIKEGDAKTTYHTHLPETGDFITATDICTIMLYEKIAGWEQHNVLSKNYLSMWNCNNNSLFTLSNKVWDKIQKDQEKRDKKSNK